MSNPDRMRALLDGLGTVNSDERARLSAASRAPSTAANPLGLRFSSGARVLDLVTGKRGLVQSGARDPQTREELFRVQLADARAVYRLATELEPDPSPAPAVGV